jgi:hypothetical protein
MLKKTRRLLAFFTHEVVDVLLDLTTCNTAVINLKTFYIDMLRINSRHIVILDIYTCHVNVINTDVSFIHL